MTNRDSLHCNRGAVVKHNRWGTLGTVMRRQGTTVLVAWYNSFIEDQLEIEDVTLIPSPPPEVAAWHGGLGVIDWRAPAISSQFQD